MLSKIALYFSWCGPCKAIAPYVHQKSQQTGIALLKVNVDKAPQLSQAYGVSSMPTFVVVAGNWNGVIQRQSGGSQQIVDYMFQAAAPYKK